MAATVLLVDDAADLRALVGRALDRYGGFSIVGQAGDGATAVGLAEREQPDVVVLDPGLPDVTDAVVFVRLRAAAPEAQVVIYSAGQTADRGTVARLAEDYVGKDQPVGALVEHVADLCRRRLRVASIAPGESRTSVSRARRFLLERCEAWGWERLAEQATLVLSELATNAVVHARSAFELRVTTRDSALRLEITDHGAGHLEVRSPRLGDERGRGLLIVGEVAAAWGVEYLGAGKCVWAELRAPAATT